MDLDTAHSSSSQHSEEEEDNEAGSFSFDDEPLLDDDNNDAANGVNGKHEGGSRTESGAGEEEEEEESSEDEEDDEADEGMKGLTAAEREILTLLAVDKKLASVLDLAATALSALRPPSPSSGGTSSEDAFKQHASEYYTALDDIQLTLRHSIHLVRKARISPQILLPEQQRASTDAAIATGPSRGARRMETIAWRDIADAIDELNGSSDGQGHVNAKETVVATLNEAAA